MNKEDVFGVKVQYDDIFTNIAFEIMLIPENDKIILVEGEIDKDVYKALFEKEKKINYSFVYCRGKKSIIEYMDFDEDPKIFGIVDRDFDENNFKRNVLITRYACLEADIINCLTINEVFIKFKELYEHKKHIIILEEFMQKVYLGKCIKWNIRKYRKVFLNMLKKEDFYKKELFKEQENNKNYYGDGIHCAKEIIKILSILDNNIDYNSYVMGLISKMSNDNLLIQNIVNNEIFN